MRYLTFIFTVLFTTAGFAGDTKLSTKKFMQDYLNGYEKYLTTDDEADISWVTEHFSEPAVMIPPSGPAPMAKHENLAPNLKYFVEKALKAKGVVKLKWNKLQLATLSDTQVLASGLVDALDKNGKTIEQRASIYILTKGKNGWAISVNLPHSPKAVPTIK